jgi:DNA-binding transcriptional LysR family regulator
MANLDLNLLPILLALYDNRSVTAAAQRLGMSQPAVSKALARSRKAFEDQLFVRTSLGLEPTNKAKQMILPIRSIMSHVQNDLISGIGFDPSKTETTFNLALSEVGELLCLPKLIRDFQVFAPRSGIKSVCPPPRDLINGLENGKIDLAIGIYPELSNSNIYRQRLALSNVACLLRADHPIRSKSLSLKKYLDLEHISVRSGHSQQIIENIFQSKELQRRVTFTTSNYLIIPEIIKSTDLVATLIFNLANYFARTHTKLKVVAAPKEIPPIEIRQFWHQRYNDDPRSKWLRGMTKLLFSQPR